LDGLSLTGSGLSLKSPTDLYITEWLRLKGTSESVWSNPGWLHLSLMRPRKLQDENKEAHSKYGMSIKRISPKALKTGEDKALRILKK